MEDFSSRLTPIPGSQTAAGILSGTSQSEVAPARQGEIPATGTEALLNPSPTVFRLPSVTPTKTNPAVILAATPTPECQDGLSFVQDLTIPDGTIVAPGTLIDKRWVVENSGGCNWDGRYRLRLISGLSLSLPDEQALFPARSGNQATVRMLLTTPSEPGTYRSAWQAINPADQEFGDPIFIEIIVGASQP